jgi:hypothetical protein
VKNFSHARRACRISKSQARAKKTRYLPLHPGTNELIHEYLEAAGYSEDENRAPFRSIRNNRTGRLDKALTPDAVYRLVRGYSAALGRMGPIFMAASCSQDVTRPIHQDPQPIAHATQRRHSRERGARPGVRETVTTLPAW